MSFYSFKNIPIKLNNNDVFANSCELSINNSLERDYQVNSRYAGSPYATNGINGKFSVSYYLTGADPIKELIIMESGIVSGNIGGINFPTGYLTNYNLSAKPNFPVVINAGFSFFNDLNGSLLLNTPYSQTGYNILNYSDISVDTLGAYSTESIGNIVSVDYNFTSELKPEYYVSTGISTNNITPSRINFGKREIEAGIVCDGQNVDLPITGKNLGVKITFNHPQIPTLSESFYCSGVLESRNFSASVDNLFLTKLTIKQCQIDPEPSISGFDPFSSSPGSYFRISGSNLLNTTSVYFGDREAITYNVINERLVSGIVPYDALTGLININAYGGKTYSSNAYQLSYPAMQINTVTYPTGLSGQSVFISGNNFYRISHVFFGNQSGNFRSVNSGLLQAYIPSYAESGYVKVVSTGRNIFANFIHGYVPTPFISGFSPPTGFSGEKFTISGFGFSGISKVQFNYIDAERFALASPISITGFLPSGNIKGYIYLQGQSGVNTYSLGKFQPSMLISGIDPLSGKYGDFITISGRNFETGLMYQQQPGAFRLKFGTQSTLTGFGLVSNIKMTGIVPYGFTNGPIYIYENDGVTQYQNTGSFIHKYETPTITNFSPNLALSGQTYYGYVEGTNFYDVTGVRFTGYQAARLNRSYTVTPANLNTDILGTRINISNFTGWVTLADSFAANDAAGTTATGRFQVYVLTRAYSVALSTTINKLTLESGSPY